MTTPSPALARLSDLSPGSIARFHRAYLDEDDCQLLRALGMTDRCLVRVCQSGEPCIVQVRTTRIGLSRVVAEGILVEPHAA